MTQISNIISTLQESTFQPSCLKEKRPFIRLNWDTYIERLTKNANQILKGRGVKREFQIYNEDMPIITQLYYYGICDEKSKYELNKGIAYLGSFGIGKTLLIQAFLMLFNQEPASKNVTFIDSIEYVNRLPSQPELYDNNLKRPLLIDDIGKEPSEINIYGTPKRPIGDLICARYNYGAPTFITSNYELSTLTNHLGKHVIDRLIELCNFIEMKGKSRRR